MSLGTTLCPRCGHNTFEVQTEPINQLVINAVNFVRCAQCKCAIGAVETPLLHSKIASLSSQLEETLRLLKKS